MLLAFPAERERWFAYRSELLHFHIQTWLDHMKIEVANVAALGARRAAGRAGRACRASLPPGEAPGEILRRQARELLDEIPAAELPPALAFLEFLRDRGPSSLLGRLPPSAVAPRSRTTTTTTTMTALGARDPSDRSRGGLLDRAGYAAAA